jgi:hypothetical protein
VVAPLAHVPDAKFKIVPPSPADENEMFYRGNLKMWGLKADKLLLCMKMQGGTP